MLLFDKIVCEKQSVSLFSFSNKIVINEISAHCKEKSLKNSMFSRLLWSG